jgi:hypothetical protein
VSDLREAIKADNASQNKILRDLQDGQHTQLSLAHGWKESIRNILKGFNNLREACVDMSNSIQQLLLSNAALSRSVRATESGLPTGLERTLIQEPFILEDAIGRIAPVHLQFIESWDAFEAVLEIRFRGIQGADKVEQREYALQDHTKGYEITRSRPWVGAFLPGQRVAMSFIFEQVADHGGDGSPQEPSCPSCGSSNAANTTALDIEWFAPPPQNTSLRIC